ncbi:hypothetical protein ACNO5E_17065 [Vibrio parahaemolyticus]|nr:hypothetical protein CTH30272_04087 [Catenococcus thiocycli]
MSDKISIVYIGPKPRKKDTITGSRLVFPQNKPVAVESDLAYQLLDFPTVWIQESELESHLKISAEHEAEQKRIQEAAELAAQEAAEQASMVVTLNGDELDLAKLNSAKLKTLIKASDLDVADKSAQESVEDFRLRVRNHIRNLETNEGE